jgi:hypothetical protein
MAEDTPPGAAPPRRDIVAGKARQSRSPAPWGCNRTCAPRPRLDGCAPAPLGCMPACRGTRGRTGPRPQPRASEPRPVDVVASSPDEAVVRVWWRAIVAEATLGGRREELYKSGR